MPSSIFPKALLAVSATLLLSSLLGAQTTRPYPVSGDYVPLTEQGAQHPNAPANFQQILQHFRDAVSSLEVMLTRTPTPTFSSDGMIADAADILVKLTQKVEDGDFYTGPRPAGAEHEEGACLPNNLIIGPNGFEGEFRADDTSNAIVFPSAEFNPNGTFNVDGLAAEQQNAELSRIKLAGAIYHELLHADEHALLRWTPMGAVGTQASINHWYIYKATAEVMDAMWSVEVPPQALWPLLSRLIGRTPLTSSISIIQQRCAALNHPVGIPEL